MKETRSGKYGKFYGRLLNKIIDLLPESQKEDYRERLLTELKRYDPSVKIKELDDVNKLDIDFPEHLARLVKEGLHLMYQAQTSCRALEFILIELEK